jgi:hypothetical protein
MAGLEVYLVVLWVLLSRVAALTALLLAAKMALFKHNIPY